MCSRCLSGGDQRGLRAKLLICCVCACAFRPMVLPTHARDRPARYYYFAFAQCCAIWAASQMVVRAAAVSISPCVQYIDETTLARQHRRMEREMDAAI